MSSATRALLGAAAGALLTLFLHPFSRPYLEVIFWHSPAVDSYRPLVGAMPLDFAIKRPATMQDASIWIQADCERLIHGGILWQAEKDGAITVALSAAAQEPDNAFWKQTAALFLHEAKREKEADEMWLRASRCKTWNDLQTRRLDQMRADLAGRYGSSQSWQYASVYYQRSTAPAEAIADYARKRLEKARTTPDKVLTESALTIRNCSVMRDGSQSFEVGIMAAKRVDEAYLPANIAPPKSEKELLGLRNRLVDRLRESGEVDLSKQINRDFIKNESWTNFVLERRWKDLAAFASLGSILASGLPSAVLVVGLVGLCLWCFGMAIHRFVALQVVFRYPAVFSVGLLAGFGAYALTLLPLAGMACGLCAWFLAFTPRTERKIEPESLGALFAFATSFLAFALTTLLSLFLVVQTPASVHVLDSLDLGHEPIFGPPSLGGLSLLVVGLILLITPFWAFSIRTGTTAVLSLAFRKLGAIMASFCIPATIVLCLGAIYVDRLLSSELKELVENEPLHYYYQR